MPKIDQIILGNKYGRLTLISELPRQNTKRVFLCKCDCGNLRNILWQNIKRGASTSCGCFAIEVNTTHGMSRTCIRNAWVNMHKRCSNPNNPAYINYGGRGITIVEEWNDFEIFKKWAESSGFEKNLTLERKNVNGNYSQDNCYWATRNTQAANRRKRCTGKNPYIGVTKANNKWKADVCINNVRIYLGVFDTPEIASNKRDTYIIKHGLPHKLNK